jgi:hypothetical protein
MAHRFHPIGLTALSLLALGFAAMPSSVRAQDTGTSSSDSVAADQLNRQINLEVRSANLYYALTLLFDQLSGTNYTIPESLKHMEISAHFTHLPLRTALETILKNSGYTYNVENGVISIVARGREDVDSPIDVSAEATQAVPRSKKVYHLTSNQFIYNTVDITTRLGGRVLPGAVGLQAGGRAGSGLGAGSGIGNGGRLGGGLGGFGGGSGSGLGGTFGGSGLGESGGLGPGSGIGSLQSGGANDGGRRRGGGGF